MRCAPCRAAQGIRQLHFVTKFTASIRVFEWATAAFLPVGIAALHRLEKDHETARLIEHTLLVIVYRQTVLRHRR
jgi:hypothetical protein